MTQRTDASHGPAGAGLIVLAAICFSTLGPLSRFAEDAGVSSLGLVTWRAGLGAAVVALFIGARLAAGIARPMRLRDIPVRDRWFMGAAAVANTILNLSVFIAFTRISIALALLIFYLYPALVAIVSVIWFGERLDRLRWGALAVSLTGLVLVLAGDPAGVGALDALGIGLAFIGGLGQLFYVIAARHGFGHVPGPQAAALTMGGAMTLYVAIALLTGSLAALAAPLESLECAMAGGGGRGDRRRRADRRLHHRHPDARAFSCSDPGNAGARRRRAAGCVAARRAADGGAGRRGRADPVGSGPSPASKRCRGGARSRRLTRISRCLRAPSRSPHRRPPARSRLDRTTPPPPLPNTALDPAVGSIALMAGMLMVSGSSLALVTVRRRRSTRR